jgi:hypothetical protein
MAFLKRLMNLLFWLLSIRKKQVREKKVCGEGVVNRRYVLTPLLICGDVIFIVLNNRSLLNYHFNHPIKT